MILFTKTQFYNIQKKLKYFFFSFEMYFTMASTITKQLEQNELIEQIVFMMSTKFKIDNKEASEYVFKKLYENTAVPAPSDAVKVSKETSKKSKKVADNVPVEAITAVVVKDADVNEAVVAKEVVKAPAKKSKYLSSSEINELLEDGPLRSASYADVTEVVVKAPAKKSKKVATVQEDTTKESSGDDAVKEVGVVKAPAKRSKKVAVVEAEVVVVKEVVKAPAKRSKKVATVQEDVAKESSGDDTAKEVGVVKAPAKKSKKVATVQEDTAKESSGDETTKESKPSKRGKKVETLKTVELSKVTEELQEDSIDG